MRWIPVEAEPSSTLDAHVEPEDLDLQTSVLGIIHGGPISGIAKPAETQQPKSLEGPLLKPRATSGKKAAQKTESSSKNSPFTKWVSPKSSSTEKESQSAPSAVASDRSNPTEADNPEEKTETDISEPLISTPSSAIAVGTSPSSPSTSSNLAKTSRGKGSRDSQTCSREENGCFEEGRSPERAISDQSTTNDTY